MVRRDRSGAGGRPRPTQRGARTVTLLRRRAISTNGTRSYQSVKQHQTISCCGKLASVRSSAERGLRLSVLGPLRAWRDGVEVDLGPGQRRLVLGLLLVRAGHRVSAAELVDGLWGEDPPPSAANLVHRHVGAIRRLFEPDLGTRAQSRWLATVGEGYRLAEPGELLDLSRFRAARAAAAAATDPGAATAAYAGALDLWQGRGCADLRTPDPAAFLHRDPAEPAGAR